MLCIHTFKTKKICNGKEKEQLSKTTNTAKLVNITFCLKYNFLHFHVSFKFYLITFYIYCSIVKLLMQSTISMNVVFYFKYL